MELALLGKVPEREEVWVEQEEWPAVWAGIEAIKPVQAQLGIAFVLIAAQKRCTRWVFPVLRSGALNATTS
ncbi:MAG: hypothetical protein Q7I94_03275 [Candidatus Contubernalis sp.]|nr:hypothetical protein [Candidatus Contubernalis sp.]